jgi:hypothetical protein
MNKLDEKTRVKDLKEHQAWSLEEASPTTMACFKLEVV